MSKANRRPNPGGTFSGWSIAAVDGIEVAFDDETLVADVGLIVPATLMVRLGLDGRWRWPWSRDLRPGWPSSTPC